MVGVASELVIITSAEANTIAVAGITIFGYAPRSRLPSRIGCSTNTNDAIEIVSVTRRRSASSGTGVNPVRSAVSHKKIGQWNR
jgi:hypothetical protein